MPTQQLVQQAQRQACSLHMEQEELEASLLQAQVSTKQAEAKIEAQRPDEIRVLQAGSCQ